MVQVIVFSFTIVRRKNEMKGSSDKNSGPSPCKILESFTVIHPPCRYRPGSDRTNNTLIVAVEERPVQRVGRWGKSHRRFNGK